MLKKIKISLFTMLLLVATASISASGSAFRKGSLMIGPAAGLSSGIGTSGVVFIGNLEYAITDHIGLGVSAGYWSYSEETSAGTVQVKSKYTVLPIAATGAYHFHISSNWDLGAGVALGYYVVSSSVESNVAGANYAATGSSGLAIGVFGLARYYVSDSIALRGKVGYGISLLEAGVDFRF
jgi:hypothetical protein